MEQRMKTRRRRRRMADVHPVNSTDDIAIRRREYVVRDGNALVGTGGYANFDDSMRCPPTFLRNGRPTDKPLRFEIKISKVPLAHCPVVGGESLKWPPLSAVVSTVEQSSLLNYFT